MKLTDITLQQLNDADEAYREANPDPQIAGIDSRVFEQGVLSESNLAFAAAVFRKYKSDPVKPLALGIAIGLELAALEANDYAPEIVERVN